MIVPHQGSRHVFHCGFTHPLLCRHSRKGLKILQMHRFGVSIVPKAVTVLLLPFIIMQQESSTVVVSAFQPVIRPATPFDVASIKVIADATDLFPSSMVDDMMAGYLGGTKTDAFWFVSCDKSDESNIAAAHGFGYCELERMTEGTWNLLAIAILPDRQGKGIGSAMIRYLEQNLLERQATAAEQPDAANKFSARILLVETLGTEEFEQTRTFYKKVGFTEEARIRDYYEDGGDKIVFWKRLEKSANKLSSLEGGSDAAVVVV
jgi:ribosomal protein S18 acetylase RimI-like enzyme